MMKIKILFNNLPKIATKFQARLLLGHLQRAADIFTTEAKAQATRGRPGLIKRSGDLEASIFPEDLEVSDTSALIGIGPHIVYGAIHELGGMAGSSSIPARPYLRPAIDKLKNTLVKVISDEATATIQETH